PGAVVGPKCCWRPRNLRVPAARSRFIRGSGRRLPDRLLVITGGGGRIGTALRPLLREHSRLRLVDVRELPRDLDGDEYVHSDMSHFADAEGAMVDAQAVLHLAGNPS